MIDLVIKQTHKKHNHPLPSDFRTYAIQRKQPANAMHSIADTSGVSSIKSSSKIQTFAIPAAFVNGERKEEHS